MLVWVSAEAVGDEAMERLRAGFIEGQPFVVEFDIANFFGEIDHDRLLTRWVGGSRIGGCSNCCDCGCRQE